jgi:hypothetical protein
MRLTTIAPIDPGAALAQRTVAPHRVKPAAAVRRPERHNRAGRDSQRFTPTRAAYASHSHRGNLIDIFV